MTFHDKFMYGGAQFCMAPADENGGAGGGGSDGESGDNGADNGGGEGNTNLQDGLGESGDGDGAGDDGDKGTGTSLADGLEDGEGQTFDFTTGEKPEGFPDEYWDAESNTVNAQALFEGMQKQEKIAKDLRAKMGKGAHKPPEKAEQYTFEPSEKSAQFIEENDPLVAAAKEVAHKHGLSQEQYEGFMAEMSDRMVDISAELGEGAGELSEEQRQAYVKEQIKAIGPNGPQVVRAVSSFVQGLGASGRISEGAAKHMTENFMSSADDVKALNELRAALGEGDSIPHDTFDDGLPPDAAIAEKLNDMSIKAKESGNHQEYMNYENEIMEKRRRAGRPDRLQF